MAPTQPKSQVAPGTIVGDKFRVTREIGRGGMAAVYEAENIHIGKRVAVKVLNAELVTSRIVRERFLREARAAAAIRSPYICDVYDSGVYDGRPFLVMELLEGESLYDMMIRVRRLDVDLTIRVATHTCRGLAKAHEANVIHRDLKPENIFLTKAEDGELVAKVLDFGLAKFYEPTTADPEQIRLTREGALFGTPAYMSPEQAKGKGDVDHRADLWALGCIVYECLTGQTVWNVDQGVAMILAQIAGAPIPKPSKLRPDMPPAFDAWFARALDRDPDKRFQEPKEFADTLAQAFQKGSVPSLHRSPAPSDEEGAVVDALVGQSHAAIPSPSSSPQQTFDLSPDDILTVRPPPSKGRGPTRAIAALVGAAAVAFGGYLLWFYVLHPPRIASPSPAQSATTSAAALAPDAGKPEKLEPVEQEPYALQIGSAQKLLAEGRLESALAMFKEAFNNGGSGVARSLLSHAGVALPKSDGPCRVTGLARPRPFDVVVMSSRPSIALAPLGPIAVWVDNHQDAARRQAFSAVLDKPLRRVSPERLVTPEAESVRHPQLVSANDKLALIYWDGAGSDPGVYVRMLASDGRIASPAHRLSGVQRHEFYPALSRAPDGSFWAVWEEQLEGNGSDLVARHLNAESEPLGDAVRLTAFASTRANSTDATKPDVSIDADHLNIVFTLEKSKKQQVMLLRIPLADPGLTTGIVDANDQKKKKRKKKEDRHLGKLTPVSASHGKNAQPRIACGQDGCFVVWDDENAGALAAFIDRKQGEALWHREFARKGSRPGIASSPTGVATTWYEGSRVKIAKITRDGVEKPTTLARVGGYQPYPAIVAGREAGEWYISWRDYEAGHLEAFVVRTQCP